MRFTVPKFIEHEAKIVGPLTFKQFLYIGIAGGISLVIYLSVHDILLVVVTAVILMGGSALLAFVNIEGRSLPLVIKDFFTFSSSPKLYIWQKAGLPPKFLKKEIVKKERKKEKVSDLKISNGKLGQLSTQLETKIK